MIKKMRSSLLSLFVLSFFTACSNSQTQLELVLKAKEELNKDVDGRSSPLMITFYELESAEKFSKSDYWTLIEKSGENLQNDLISQTKHIILTNQKQTFRIAFNEKAKYIGILCNFRVIDNNYIWKDIVELKNKSNNFAEFEIKNFNLERVK